MIRTSVLTTPINEDSPLVAAMLSTEQPRRKFVSSGADPRTPGDELADDPRQLARLLNTLFWTSLYSEEGRQVRGRVVIASQSQCPWSRSLSSTIPADERTLISLLTAAQDNAIGIESVDGVPHVWGFVDELPLFTQHVRIRSPGVLVAVGGPDGGVTAVFDRGEIFVPPKADSFRLVSLIENALGAGIALVERLTLATRLAELVAALHGHGHGGTLIVVPREVTLAGVGDVLPHFSFLPTGQNAVSNILAQIAEIHSRQEEVDRLQSTGPDLARFSGLLAHSEREHSALLKKALRRIGSLSAIDGAVIIDHDFNVLTFGGKLTATATCETAHVFNTLTSKHETRSISALGGTRHQSAACFVQKHADALAIVASQDGRLSLMAHVHQDHSVIVFQRLEYLV